MVQPADYRDIDRLQVVLAPPLDVASYPVNRNF